MELTINRTDFVNTMNYSIIMITATGLTIANNHRFVDNGLLSVAFFFDLQRAVMGNGSEKGRGIIIIHIEAIKCGLNDLVGACPTRIRP